jgi:catechol 2,3-dioxygenase-like lactoylglutathione lyase family enzyme
VVISETREDHVIGYVTIGSNDIARSYAFFDAAFEPLGYQRTFEGGGWAGYGPGGKKEGLEIYLATPENGQSASLGNGSMLAFKAPSRAAVEAFHAAALAAGGRDEGKPGVRGEMDPPFYGAYVRDPEGNKFCAYYKG